MGSKLDKLVLPQSALGLKRLERGGTCALTLEIHPLAFAVELHWRGIIGRIGLWGANAHYVAWLLPPTGGGLSANQRPANWLGGAQLLQAGAPEFVLIDQIVKRSFLLQVRVQVLDAAGETVADSGLPSNQQVLMVSGGGPGMPAASVSLAFTDTFTTPLPAALPGMFFVGSDQLAAAGGDVTTPLTCQFRVGAAVSGECSSQPLIIQYHQAGPAAGSVVSFTEPLTEPLGPIGVAMPLVGSLYGFELEASTEEMARSTERAEQVLVDNEGHHLGVLVLSDGPAYGREILLSAMTAWAGASLLAMVLAGLAGVWMSGRLTQPLLALTRATESMAAGNLAVRAETSIVSEFGQLSYAFNSMAERVTDTIQTLRQFVADAAHELNTPLTALQTNVELAASAQGMERDALLARIQTQVERLQNLVAGLLSLSRLEGQPAVAQQAQVDVIALVQTLSEVYASRAEQAGLTFEVELPAEPLEILGDAPQLRRALENLLDNALKFTPTGGTVRLIVNRVKQSVQLRVDDTGIGISPEDQPILFQRFRRGRNAAPYPGSGLGLAIIVHAIVKAHAGEVSVASTSAGTHCAISLPLPTA